MRYRNSVVIRNSVPEVFALLTDIDRFPQWIAELETAEKTSEGPLGVGATWAGVASFMGRRLESDHEITSFEPERKFGYRTTTSPVPGRLEYTLEPVPEGTRITIVAEVEPRGALRLARPVLARAGRRMYEHSLEALKAILEGGAGNA